MTLANCSWNRRAGIWVIEFPRRPSGSGQYWGREAAHSLAVIRVVPALLRFCLRSHTLNIIVCAFAND